jgi:hypothetical protein
MTEPVSARPGFASCIFDCASSARAEKVFVASGLGPAKLMSPFKMFAIRGRSLILFSLEKLQF